MACFPGFKTTDVNPADGMGTVFIGASRDEIVPGKSKRYEQQGTDANRHNRTAPGHVIDDNTQRIDAGRQ